MSKDKVVEYALYYGWKQWGNPRPRPYNGSIYTCYRRGNMYLWIGDCFVERSDSATAVDYLHRQSDRDIETCRFLYTRDSAVARHIRTI